MSTLNETPSGSRLHIGIYGKTNSGKSSLINALTNQKVSIVADIAGTTTDPVYKPMEINPLGPCVIIDTAGFDDESELGRSRVEKTHLAAEKTDIAVVVLDASGVYEAAREDQKQKTAFCDVFLDEDTWIKTFKKKKTPVLVVLNKSDLITENVSLCMEWLKRELNPGVSKNSSSMEIVAASAKEKSGIGDIKSALTRLMPEDYGQDSILGDLVSDGDVVLLVMPQDIQAPKGRLILPQVQTLRELLDKKCIVMSVTTDKLTDALKVMAKPPKLIVTDSQVFGYVYENKPKESMLTSFSVLFAAYKGNLPYYVSSAKAIDALTKDSKVLIAECCTHAPLAEDIGRVKIPGMLKKRIGEGLTVDIVSGTDFPQDLSEYDLIIQCGACMFNRKYVLSRIDRAQAQKVPMTNYGVTIAHLTGILDKVIPDKQQESYSETVNMGYEHLMRSLTDIISEQQAKLGYRKETVRLYYPLSTLNHFFETEMTSEQMLGMLKESDLPQNITDSLGIIKATQKNDRFCIEIPPQGSEYVHENVTDDLFIRELIKIVSVHECKKQQILNLFKKYSDEIEMCEINSDEFDFYIRFLNNPDDNYYYCFHDEGCHMIYHRFLPQDYADLYILD